jgi:hypothetical protein
VDRTLSLSDPAPGPAPPRVVSPPGPPAPEEIRISNHATYWPIAPMDLVVGAQIAVRLLLGATPVGRVVQAAVFGAYLGSAVRDWRDRQALRRINFRREFGADLDHLVPMPRDVREAGVRRLAERLSDEFTRERPSRRALAVEVDRHLTSYIAGITGQRVQTSIEVRSFALARLALPFALGVCDILSGDIAIFRDTGLFEPHIIAHEFSHRKGYWKELHAQVLAYLSLAESGDPVLRQSALLERVYRDLCVLAGDDAAELDRLVTQARFRLELEAGLRDLRLPPGGGARRVAIAMRSLYDTRMRVTGQNGISDYDLGFTNFLYSFETSAHARQRARPI